MHYAALSFMSVCLAGAAERPNILLVITDDQGYGDVGFHANPILKTPRSIGWLARERGSIPFTSRPSVPPRDRVCSPGATTTERGWSIPIKGGR